MARHYVSLCEKHAGFCLSSAASESQWDGGKSFNKASYAYNYKAPQSYTGRCGHTNEPGCGVSLGDPDIGAASLAVIENPAGTILITEGSGILTTFDTRAGKFATEATLKETGACSNIATYQYPHCLRTRHMDTMNTIFADGHVKAMNWRTILGSTTDPKVTSYWTTTG